MNPLRIRRAMVPAATFVAVFAVASGPAARSAATYRPRVDYQLNCQGCHLADGSGEAGRVPSLRGVLVPFAQIPAGRRYLIQVPGVSESSLSDRATAAVLNWMIQRLSDVPVPPHVVPFTTAEVARWRRIPLTNVAATRASVQRLVAAQTSSRARSTASRSTDKSPM
ncbi:MAG: cytochrome c [Gammaproteobacteria bacterium]|nr:cytochrome c [Gammaproteobacteria bacterium]